MRKRGKEPRLWLSLLGQSEENRLGHCHEREMKRISEMTSEQALILDLGCGGAFDLSYLWRRGRVAIGLDNSSAALAVARDSRRRLGGQFELLRAEMEHLPFRNDTFDIVYSILVMQYSRNTKGILLQVRRILKPGGCLLIYVPYRYTPFTLRKRVLIALGRWEWGWEKEFSRRSLRKALEESGYEVMDSWEGGMGSYAKSLLNLDGIEPWSRALEGRRLRAYKQITSLASKLLTRHLPTSIVCIARKSSEDLSGSIEFPKSNQR
jgi:SAM-dependent methyltransferase